MLTHGVIGEGLTYRLPGGGSCLTRHAGWTVTTGGQQSALSPSQCMAACEADPACQYVAIKTVDRKYERGEVTPDRPSRFMRKRAAGVEGVGGRRRREIPLGGGER